MPDVFSNEQIDSDAISWFLKLKQVTQVNYNNDPMIQACNFITKRFHHSWFPVINAKFWRTPISKSICDRLLLEIYLLLLFWFLEEISEVPFCWRSTKSMHPEVSFQYSCCSLAWNFVKLKTASWIFLNEFCKVFILRASFYEDTSGWLFLILRKLHIQTFNPKQICSLDQYCWHASFCE